jgi:2-dehydro-3-deoxy-D-gluconate 5-dehydrogenase
MSNKILDQFSLIKKKSIVVGGAGDLGSSIVEALVDAGSETVIVDLDEKVFSICDNLKLQGYNVHAIKADISDRLQIRSSFENAINMLGGELDILVNTAGIQRRHPSEVFPEKDWDEVIAVNLDATFFYSQLAANIMIPKGGGKIINIASMISFFGGITIPAYAASKGGVAQLTKAFSNDWASKGITVNAIAPGYMDTQLNIALMNDPIRTSEVLNRIPMKRWGNGSDLKGLAVFLASSASDYITGTVIPVDGGYLVR